MSLLGSRHLAKLADLAFAFTYSRKEPLTPFDCLGLRIDLHHRISIEKSVFFRERSIAHAELSRIDPNTRSFRARLEALGAEKHASLRHLLNQLSYSFHFFGAGQLVRFCLSGLVQQHESHCDRSLSR